MNFTSEITSRNNPVIKAAAMLLSSGGRKKAGCFLLEGARLVCDASQNGKKTEALFLTENALNKYPEEISIAALNAEKIYLINESIAEKLSDTASTQQIFAVCRMSEAETEIAPDGMYILTESIQNPDNLGAIARTAEALGATGIIVCRGCDIYSPKALRASMGALLRLPVIIGENSVDTAKKCIKNGMRVFATVPDFEAQSIITAEKNGGCVCVIGNEGGGISKELLEVCTDRITIPMKGRAESLNASAAAAICIWEFMKERL